MSRELGLFLATEETVNPLESLSGLSHWQLEMSSFLKEVKCNKKFLFEGDLEQRLNKPSHRYILLEFLLDEILAAQILKFGGSGSGSGSEVVSSTASQLCAAVKALELQPPPANVSPEKFFGKLEERIRKLEPSKREKLIGTPLFSGGKLSESQWQILNQVRPYQQLFDLITNLQAVI
jgi:hypothetical protein